MAKGLKYILLNMRKDQPNQLHYLCRLCGKFSRAIECSVSVWQKLLKRKIPIYTSRW